MMRFAVSWDRGCVPLAFVATALYGACLPVVQRDRLVLFMSGVPHACLLVVLSVWQGRVDFFVLQAS